MLTLWSSHNPYDPECPHETISHLTLKGYCIAIIQFSHQNPGSPPQFWGCCGCWVWLCLSNLAFQTDKHRFQGSSHWSQVLMVNGFQWSCSLVVQLIRRPKGGKINTSSKTGLLGQRQIGDYRGSAVCCVKITWPWYLFSLVKFFLFSFPHSSLIIFHPFMFPFSTSFAADWLLFTVSGPQFCFTGRSSRRHISLV